MTIITKETPVGQEFSGKPKKITWERLWTFSGGPFAASGWPKKNIHTDIDFAKNAGLPTACASGTQYQGYVIQLLIDLFGEEWLKNGKMNVKFIKLVPEGDTLIAKAKVQSKEEDGSAVKYTLDIWCENQNGDKVLVGTASGLVKK
ncbi:MAG: hypothetical protein PWP65_1366 [Clostridia bacterium]|nr:hypothetical protein [Clostridia bacterium]